VAVTAEQELLERVPFVAALEESFADVRAGQGRLVLVIRKAIGVPSGGRTLAQTNGAGSVA
jgi:hypothetical protein